MLSSCAYVVVYNVCCLAILYIYYLASLNILYPDYVKTWTKICEFVQIISQRYHNIPKISTRDTSQEISLSIIKCHLLNTRGKYEPYREVFIFLYKAISTKKMKTPKTQKSDKWAFLWLLPIWLLWSGYGFEYYVNVFWYIISLQISRKLLSNNCVVFGPWQNYYVVCTTYSMWNYEINVFDTKQFILLLSFIKI